MTDTAILKTIEKLCNQAKQQAMLASTLTPQQKNDALYAIAESLHQNREVIITANQEDQQLGKANNLDDALIDRLVVNEKIIQGMVTSLHQVANLADPVGAINNLTTQPSGIQVGKMNVPIGVIAIIYESRPNVTTEAASLCLKSGNVCLLKGGSEALHSNLAIMQCIKQGLKKAQLPSELIQFIDLPGRDSVSALLQQEALVDVIIPRGGKGLIEAVSKGTQIPVIKHLDGVCHVYIDQAADPDKAFNIAVNAKTQRYGTCNTMETLLIHRDLADTILPKLEDAYTNKGVELRGCSVTQKIIQCNTASEEDWSTEYLAPILSIKVVDSTEQAIAHIHQYGSSHTESIITENHTTAMHFLRAVDSSSVMVNTSTRFADGSEYGLGAEIGISTNKLHARGPVGLEGLTTQKFVVLSDGKVRS